MNKAMDKAMDPENINMKSKCFLDKLIRECEAEGNNSPMLNILREFILNELSKTPN